MFLSSFEYLKALREGDFLRFLEWPAFVELQYRDGKIQIGSDTLMDCLIYEWLVQGCLELDKEQMAILYAVYELDPSPLHAGKYAFPLITLISAFFSCTAYHFHGLDQFNVPKTQMSAKQLTQFMQVQLINVDETALSNSISLVRDEFMKQIPLVNKKTLYLAYKKINDITQHIATLEKYLEFLNLVQNQELSKNLYSTRLGIVQSFYSYLLQQTELTDEVVKEMARYVNAIRCQQPAAWEEGYLHNISPLTLGEQTWSTFTSLGSGFFTLVLPKAKEEVQPINESNSPKNDSLEFKN